MGNALKQVISLAVLIGIIYGGLWIFKDWRKSQEELPPGLTLYSDGTATLTGKVLKNETGCYNDAGTHCILTVQSGDKKVNVNYSVNDDYFCENETASAQGRAARIGENVRVRGTYRKDRDTHGINTCSSREYYITVVN